MGLGYNWVDVGQGVIFLVGALLATLGVRRGMQAPPPTKPAEVITEVAGALVDNSSVHKLTVAVEAHTIELMQSRKCFGDINETLEDTKNELRELRGSINRLGDAIYMKR